MTRSGKIKNHNSIYMRGIMFGIGIGVIIFLTMELITRMRNDRVIPIYTIYSGDGYRMN